MKLIRAAPGDNVDDSAARLPVFRTIAVAEHLELLDGVDRGVYQNGSVRSNVVVVHTIHVKNVAGGIVSIYREIHTRQQAFILAVEVRLGGNSGHQLRQLRE